MKFQLPNLDIMRNAAALLKERGPLAATAAIQRSLNGLSAAPATGPAMRDLNPSPKAAPAPASAAAQRPATTPPFVAELLAELGAYADVAGRTSGRVTPQEAPPGKANSDARAVGKFLPGSYTNHAGSREYKLYQPSGYAGEPLPLIVMLHGCTQNPDDFAAGTRMNAIADERRCLVLYPAQSKSANSSGCWNWFQSADQQREHGEPAIIAGMTREIIAQHGVDPAQVFVAGLSAGGAMALIMGTVYPDLFTAVGVHSGLPYASARDLPSALAAMRGTHRAAAQSAQGRPLPIIVFHGDQDKTVNAANARQIMDAWSAGQDTALTTRESSGGQGRAWVKASTTDSDGHVLAEEWTVRGAGHAWSGGSSRGSYTDGSGPDASSEMVRFFFTQPKSAPGAGDPAAG